MYHAFKVAVEVLIWIQLRRASRQEEHLQITLDRLAFQPSFHDFGMVYPQVIKNQKDFAGRRFDQRAQEFHQNLGGHG